MTDSKAHGQTVADRSSKMLGKQTDRQIDRHKDIHTDMKTHAHIIRQGGTQKNT